MSLKSCLSFKALLCATLVILVVISFVRFDVKSVSSDFDRRDLAVYPSLKDADGKLNSNYLSQINSYLEDRFGLRQVFLRSDYVVKTNTDNNIRRGNMTWNTKTNWFNYSPIGLFTDDMNSRFVEGLKKIDAYFKSQGTELYLVMIPEPYEVYREECDYIKKDLAYREKTTLKEVETQTDIPVIYPLDRLEENSTQDFVYFKADHHLTDFGSYIVYKQISERIQKDYPDLQIMDWESLPKIKTNKIRSDRNRNFHIGQTALSMGINTEDHLDVTYTYYDPQPKFEIKELGANKQPYRVWHNEQGYPLKIYMLGTSFNENLVPFFGKAYSDIYYTRLNGNWKDDELKILKYRKELVETFKPNIAILTICPKNVKDFLKADFAQED